MGMNRNLDTRTEPAKQGVQDVVSEPNEIEASTPYDSEGRNLTAYGGLLPIATMLEKLGFRQQAEWTPPSSRRMARRPLSPGSPRRTRHTKDLSGIVGSREEITASQVQCQPRRGAERAGGA